MLFLISDEVVRPDRSWPIFGMIEMKNVYLRYDINEPYVLRNLNFTVLPREKVSMPFVKALIETVVK